MAAGMNSVALLGGTGLVGSQILAALTALPSPPTIHALGRKPFPTPTPTLTAHISTDSSTWHSTLTHLTPPPTTLLSALGTTRAQAGSFAAQRKIDYDLNLSLARSAKEAGVKTYVLISSAGVSATSPWPYGKMKAELEEAVKGLGFLHTVILKPGLLMGERQDFRLAEAALQGLARGMRVISNGLTDFWAQDVDVIGKAAVAAAVQCADGKREEGVWVVSQSDIIRLGQTEWKK